MLQWYQNQTKGAPIMGNNLVYLDSYCLQNDMRIRLPKAILTNLSAEKGKTVFDIYFNVETKEIVLSVRDDAEKEIDQ